MIVIAVDKLEPAQKTYECLRCGELVKPGDKPKSKPKKERQLGGAATSE
jgi:hypothetical protein